MKRFAFLSLPLAAFACGDNGTPNNPIDATPDVAVIDTPIIDTPIIDTPTPIDAPDGPPPITYSGTISLLEAKVLNPGPTTTSFLGQGVQVGITFTNSDTTMFPGPVMEEQPGSPLGCKAWEYTPAQVLAGAVGLNEGTVDVFSPTGTTADTNKFVPTCSHTAGVGYLCPHTGTLSTGGTIAAGPQAGLATLTDADVTFNAGNTTNRYVNIQGGAANNNGTFPIVGLGGANTIVYANAAFSAETLPVTAVHVNLAGVGPTPGAADPGFLTNETSLDFRLTAGGGNHFTTFTAMPPPSGTVGDGFALANTELNKLNALPLVAGQPFTVSCDATVPTGCPAGSASGTLINIITTDGPTAGQSPFALPLPTTRRRQVRCASLGQAAVTVPAAYADFLRTSGFTRIQSTFIRPLLMGGGPPTVTAISGHAIVGYTNVP